MEGFDRSECRDCELAIYCFTESSQWVFRTMKDVEEVRKAIETCPCYQSQKTAFSRNGKP